MITNIQHVESNGCVCPFCGSESIEGDSFDVNNGYVSQEMSCLDCESTWIDIYRLIGFEFPERGEP